MSEPNEWNRELGVLNIAAPCRSRWESMIGSDVKRYCTRCHLNVYNLSSMSTEDARALLQKAEGRLCVRFYGRGDGTVMTRDCPVGIAARLRRKLLGAAAACVAVLFALLKWVRLHAPEEAIASQPLQRIAMTPSTPPEPKKPDDSWMEKRRALLGPRDPRGPGAPERLMLGRMVRSIQVIRGNSS